jgi:hypothetical protein
MSYFTDDQKPLDGRKNTLKDVEVPLRDQIVKKLYNKVQELQLPQKVREAWTVESSRVAEMLERQQVFLNDLDDFLPAGNEEASTGTSNLHIPMPHIVSKAYIARFMEALWSVDPPFVVKARREDGIDKVQIIEDLMRYTLYNWANCYEGAEEAVETWITAWANTGTGILKTKWVNQYTSFIDAVDVPEAGVPQFTVDENGREIAIPTIKTVEKEERKTITKFAGPMLEPVRMEDFIMVNGQGDPNKAEIVIHRYFVTASDLWTNVDKKIFDEEAVEAVIRGGRSYRSGALNNSIKTQKAEIAGVASVDSTVENDKYEILEAYVKADVDDSGITSDIVMWVSGATSELLRATYLYRLNPTGENPFTVAHFHKRDDQEYGVGLLELLHPLSVELDAMHNIRIDFGIITNNPTFFYRASSSLNADTIQVEPGMGIPVDDPARDVYFPQRPNSTGFFGNEEQVIQTYIERLTGISDISLGAMSGSQGAARTATGARALMTESNTNLSVHLRRLNRGWKKVLRSVFHLLQQKIDGQFVFRITGQDGRDVFRKIYSHDLMLDIDFELAPNTANSNKAVQIDMAQQLVQIASNPLNLQLGITDAGSVYEAYKMLGVALGMREMSRILKKPQGYAFVPSPEEIFQRVVRGQEIKPDPRMDIDGVLAFFQTMLESQQKFQSLTEDQMKAAAGAMREFQQLKEAVEAQAAQAANAQQMQVNAAMSAQQAPAGMNPLAGAQPGQLPLAQI